MMMGEYDPLKRFLSNAPAHTREITLSFAQIEQILGRALPPSAFDYPQWWENDGTHSQAKAWQGAGWKTIDTDLVGKHVTFVRSKE